MFQVSVYNIDILISKNYWEEGENFFFSFLNLFLKWKSVSSSIIQNSIVSRVVLLFCKNLIDSSKRILAHLSLGKPNIPELIAGIEILL